jgi:hypothetical protein
MCWRRCPLFRVVAGVCSGGGRGALGSPSQWYLSPTLHTPALLETIPKGVLAGAHGVASGTVAGASDFRARFEERWHSGTDVGANTSWLTIGPEGFDPVPNLGNCRSGPE